MARGNRSIPACCKSYGFPIYCAAWVSLHRIEEEKLEESEQKSVEKDESIASPQLSAQDDRLIAVLGGGGGEGRSGIPNAVVVTEFDVANQSLADQPLSRMETNSDAPYRMAVHPGGDGLICAFQKDCRWYKWSLHSKSKLDLTLEASKKDLPELEGAGLQLALAFNSEGSVFATGGEDGNLRVFKWPSMEVVLKQDEVHTTVKDLGFSLDSKFLVAAWESGPCRVWDLESSTSAATLQRQNGEVFRFCKFSQNGDSNHILYVAAIHGQYGTIISWDPKSWTRIGTKKVVHDPISAFNVSSDGRFLAIGTVEGDVVILLASNMRVVKMVKKAHLGIVTAVEFSANSRALLSSSFDYTSRVTLVGDKESKGLNMILVVLVFIIACLLYFIKYKAD